MARWLQLATVAADGTPRVRTLVFRGWGAASHLDLLTDGRSAKLAELQANPAVELAWLLPKARAQYRLRGQAQILSAAPASVTTTGRRSPPAAGPFGVGPNPVPPSGGRKPFPPNCPLKPRFHRTSCCCASPCTRWNCSTSAPIPTAAVAGALVMAMGMAGAKPSSIPNGQHLGQVSRAFESRPTTAPPQAPAPGPARQGSEPAQGSSFHPLPRSLSNTAPKAAASSQ